MVSVVQREWAAKNPRAIFKDPITVVIVSLGLVRFRRAAAPIEAKIRSIGTMQLPHSHRILVGSVLVSRCRMSLRGLATPDLDLIKQVEQECRTATSSASTDQPWERTDDRFAYGEVRVYAIGLVNGIEITVIYTDRDPDERHISAWRSEPHERRYFWNHLQD